jgi:hypothetical protein
MSSAGSAKSSAASAVNPNVWDETAEDKSEGLAEKRIEGTEIRPITRLTITFTIPTHECTVQLLSTT